MAPPPTTRNKLDESTLIDVGLPMVAQFGGAARELRKNRKQEAKLFEKLHPRNRVGRFRDVFNKLDVGQEAVIEGVRVKRVKSRLGSEYIVHGGGDSRGTRQLRKKAAIVDAVERASAGHASLHAQVSDLKQGRKVKVQVTPDTTALVTKTKDGFEIKHKGEKLTAKASEEAAHELSKRVDPGDPGGKADPGTGRGAERIDKLGIREQILQTKVALIPALYAGSEALDKTLPPDSRGDIHMEAVAGFHEEGEKVLEVLIEHISEAPEAIGKLLELMQGANPRVARVERRLLEARGRRLAATSTTEWTRARAEEVHFMEEARVLSKLHTIDWNPSLHLRGRTGQFRNMPNMPDAAIPDMEHAIGELLRQRYPTGKADPGTRPKKGPTLGHAPEPISTPVERGTDKLLIRDLNRDRPAHPAVTGEDKFSLGKSDPGTGHEVTVNGITLHKGFKFADGRDVIDVTPEKVSIRDTSMEHRVMGNRNRTSTVKHLKHNSPVLKAIVERHKTESGGKADPGTAPVPSTTLGVTPFLKSYSRQPRTYSEAMRVHRDPVWRERYGKPFESDIRALADKHGVKVDEFVPNAGVYKGHYEPSYAVKVRGPDTKVEAFNRALGSKYKQESVVGFRRDPKGTDREVRFEGIAHPDAFYRDLVEALGSDAGASYDGSGSARVFIYGGDAKQVAAVKRLAGKHGTARAYRGRGHYIETGGGN